MAIVRTTTEVFANTYEVKNGQVGSQDVLNFAVHKLKTEFNALWNWAAGEDTTLLNGTLSDFIIDDRPFTELENENVQVDTKVRSIAWIDTNIIKTPRDITNSTTRGWSTESITWNIKNNVSNGGTWG